MFFTTTLLSLLSIVSGAAIEKRASPDYTVAAGPGAAATILGSTTQVPSGNPGLYSFQVANDGTYAISATGAGGGKASTGQSGGLGIRAYGQFPLKAGTTYYGINPSAGGTSTNGAGGGGGAASVFTFVTSYDDSGNPVNTYTYYIIGGGGGGGAATGNGANAQPFSTGDWPYGGGSSNCYQGYIGIGNTAGYGGGGGGQNSGGQTAYDCNEAGRNANPPVDINQGQGGSLPSGSPAAGYAGANGGIGGGGGGGAKYAGGGGGAQGGSSAQPNSATTVSGVATGGSSFVNTALGKNPSYAQPGNVGKGQLSIKYLGA